MLSPTSAVTKASEEPVEVGDLVVEAEATEHVARVIARQVDVEVGGGLDGLQSLQLEIVVGKLVNVFGEAFEVLGASQVARRRGTP